MKPGKPPETMETSIVEFHCYGKVITGNYRLLTGVHNLDYLGGKDETRPGCRAAMRFFSQSFQGHWHGGQRLNRIGVYH